MSTEQKIKLDREDVNSGADAAERVVPLFAEALKSSHDPRVWWMGFYSGMLAYGRVTIGEEVFPTVAHVLNVIQGSLREQELIDLIGGIGNVTQNH